MTFEEYWKSTGLEVGFEDCAKNAARDAWKAAMDLTYNSGWQDAMSRLPKGSLVPEGYVLVPVEPTETAVEAIMKRTNYYTPTSGVALYKAVIQAAQEVGDDL